MRVLLYTDLIPECFVKVCVNGPLYCCPVRLNYDEQKRIFRLQLIKIAVPVWYHGKIFRNKSYVTWISAVFSQHPVFTWEARLDRKCPTSCIRHVQRRFFNQNICISNQHFIVVCSKWWYLQYVNIVRVMAWWHQSTLLKPKGNLYNIVYQHIEAEKRWPTFPNGFSWMKMYDFRIKFHWSLFPGVLLTTFQHCFR